MKKLTLFFFCILFLAVSMFAVLVNADCSGCSSGGNCYALGQIVNSSYCDITRDWVEQKTENSSCMNSFECLSGYCVEDKCINYGVIQKLIEQGQYKEEVEKLLQQGKCTATPGCLNLTSLANAQNVSGLCVGSRYKCFQCNSDTPHWNGSACTISPCDSSPGCWNASLVLDIDNSENVSGLCNPGFLCIECESGYSWNGTWCNYISPVVSPNFSWISTTSVGNQLLINGYNTALKKGYRIKTVLDGEEHFIGVVKLSSSIATIEFMPNQQADFSAGQKREFDVNDDGENDFSIKLINITGDKANLAIKLLVPVPPTPTPKPTPTPTPVEPEPSNWLAIFIIALIILIIIVIAAILFLKLRKPKTRSQNPAAVQKNYPSYPQTYNRRF